MPRALLVIGVIIGGTVLLLATVGVDAAAAWAWGWALTPWALWLRERWRERQRRPPLVDDPRVHAPGDLPRRSTFLRGRRACARLLLRMIDQAQAMADLCGAPVYVCRIDAGIGYRRFDNPVIERGLFISSDGVETEHRKVICILYPRAIGTRFVQSERLARAQDFRRLLEIMARAQALADSYRKTHFVVQYDPPADKAGIYESPRYFIGHVKYDYEVPCKIICRVEPRS